MIKTDVFRFVSLRAVQKIDLQKEDNYFPAPENGPIVKAAKECNKDQLNNFINQFIQSEKYVTSFLNSKGLLLQTGKLLSAIQKKKNISVEDFFKLSHHFLHNSEPQKLNELEEDLWNSLYISIIRMRQFLYDRSDIINALRILQILKKGTSESTNQKQLDTALKALSTIPEYIFQPCIKTNSDPVKPHPGPVVIDQTGAINNLKTGIDNLFKVIAKIERVERKKFYELDQYHSSKKETKTRNAKDTAGNDPEKGDVKNESDHLKFDWRLNENELDRLSDTAKLIFEELNLDPQTDTTQRLINSMEIGLKMTYNTLYQDNGIRHVSTIGKGVTSGNNKTKQRYTMTPHQAGLEDPSQHYPPLIDIDTYNNSIQTSLGTVKPLGMGDLLVVNNLPMPKMINVPSAANLEGDNIVLWYSVEAQIPNDFREGTIFIQGIFFAHENEPLYHPLTGSMTEEHFPVSYIDVLKKTMGQVNCCK